MKTLSAGIAIVLAASLSTGVANSQSRTPVRQRSLSETEHRETVQLPERQNVVPGFWNVDPEDPESFRLVLMTWALSVEEAFGTHHLASTYLAQVESEALATLLQHMDNDVVPFYEATARIVERLETEEVSPYSAETPPGGFDSIETGPWSPAPSAGPTTPYRPDYPPYDGKYAQVILTGINNANAGFGATFKDRCDSRVWADWYVPWYLIWKTVYELESTCTVVACEPFGLACAFACGAYEIALTALGLFEIPLQLCSVHEGNIDSAEIEAAYENTVRTLDAFSDLSDEVSGLSTDLRAHDTSMSDLLYFHDMDVTSASKIHEMILMGHDWNIDSDLQAHDLSIRNRSDVIQTTLDEAVELRRVHIQVLEATSRERYLIVTTEAGQPVDVVFESMEVFEDSSFVNLTGASLTSIDRGTYVLALSVLRAPDAIFRFRVRHDDVVDHFGEVIYQR